jgi:predicted enzyme related to lactoylglutathione lyase
MTPRRSYPPGVPCWIDVEQGDPEATRHFYGRLMDWGFAASEDWPDHYVASLDGMAVAGVGLSAGASPAWTTYVAVADVDRGAEAVVDAGGSIESAPPEGGAAARLVHCSDPAGVRFGIWQAGERAGSELVNVPGAWNFSDLHTADPEAALRFYGPVFGWEVKAIDVGAGEWATLLRVPGYGEHLEEAVDADIRERHREGGAPDGFSDGIAWLAPLRSERDDPHWHVTLLVADRDEAVGTAQRLGGEILGTRDTRWNLSALLLDPQGATLTLSQYLSGT